MAHRHMAIARPPVAAIIPRAACLLALLPACGAGMARAEEVEFSGKRAFEHLVAICELGPRPSGSDAIERQRVVVERHFRGLGARVERQAFQIRDRRTGNPVRMENLVVQWHPDRAERLLIGCHYDTRPFPDRDPRTPRGVFIGANDGASGVALLMELGRAMPGLEGTLGVDFVLFDAEEYVVEPRDPYCLGSNYFARHYASSPPPHRYRLGVIVDMVADKDLQIFQEEHSVDWPDTRVVVDSIWGTAARMGVRQFVPRPKYAVEDDHVPLRMIGRIPTCDVIDFEYPQWHTTEDTPENCSAESLEAVGRVILEWMRSFD